MGVLGLTPDQLKKEIQTNVAAALKHGAITGTLGSTNETYIVLSPDELNTTLERKDISLHYLDFFPYN